jgi:outer membrane protein assembly factor BamB
VSGDEVLLAADDGTLRALDRATGEVRWSHASRGSTPFASSPTIASGTIYLGDARGILYALDAATGDERWHYQAKSYMSSPAIVDGLVYVGGDDGILRAIGGTDVTGSGSSSKSSQEVIGTLLARFGADVRTALDHLAL